MGFNGLVHFCHRSLRAADLGHEADQIDHGTRFARFGRDQFAQEPFGFVLFPTRQIEAQQGLLVGGIVRENLHHLAQLGFDRIHVAQLTQHVQTLAPVHDVVTIPLQQPIHACQCGADISVAQIVVDHDVAQHFIVGCCVQQGDRRLCLFAPSRCVIRNRCRAVAACNGDRLHIHIVRGNAFRLSTVAFDFFPVGRQERHLGQGQTGFEIIGILFHQTQILTIGLVAVVKLLLHDLGQFMTRLLMAAIQLKDIAQLNHGAVVIALSNQRETVLIVFFGLFFRRLTGRQCQRQRKGHKKRFEKARDTHSGSSFVKRTGVLPVRSLSCSWRLGRSNQTPRCKIYCAGFYDSLLFRTRHARADYKQLCSQNDRKTRKTA